MKNLKNDQIIKHALKYYMEREENSDKDKLQEARCLKKHIENMITKYGNYQNLREVYKSFKKELDEVNKLIDELENKVGR